MKIIDFHTHYYPAKIAEKVKECARVPIRIEVDRAGLLDSMHTSGVALSLALPLVNTPGNSRGLNHWAVAESAAPVLLSGSVHPDEPNPVATLEFLNQSGIKGIKLHPEYQNFSFDSRKLDPVFQRCSELGMFVLTHAGYDIAAKPPFHCNPRMLLAVRKRFPKLKLIAAHLGSMHMAGWVLSELAGKGLYFDTAFMLPATCPASYYREIIRVNGSDRILFGSDSPWCLPGAVMGYLERLRLPQSDLERILGGNAAELLGR